MKKKTGTSVLHSVRLIGFFIALLVFVGAGLYWFSAYNTNITKLDAYVSTPVGARFADDVSAVLYDNIPDINNNRGIVPQSYLQISYDAISEPRGPAFRYNTPLSELGEYIKIKPAIRGTWTMPSPYELVFMPEHNWPAGTKFDIKIDKHLFNNDARPNTKNVSFTTAHITATVDTFNVYPINGFDKSVVGVAVVSFNYPIQTKDFADKVSMRIDGKNIDFDVKFDRYLRTAIIQTAPIKITEKPQTLRFKLNRVPDSDNKSWTKKITAKTIINSLDTFFKVSDLSTVTADDKNGTPQQLVLLEMTAAAKAKTDWNKYINIYLLPRTTPQDEDGQPHRWELDEVNQSVLQKSEKLPIKLVTFVNPVGVYQYAFSYNVADTVPRYIYVSVKPNIQSENGFVSQNGVNRVMPVAYPERSVKIAGSGALLSLAGDKTVGIVARGGVETAYINLYKIESGEINHLITQTYNLFSGPEFRAPWAFDAYDMAVVFQKKIPFSDKSLNRANYASLNLGEYLDRTYQDKTGIFIIKTAPSEHGLEYGDARLILLTNLGIIRKINLDQSSVVFVSLLSSGAPAPDINISVLGRNGQPIWAGITNADGRVDIPHFSSTEYKNEKEPVAVVARRDSDVSFIPFYADSAQTDDYSKFDTGGVYASTSVALQSFVFSDRGIYRPGETVTIGAMVENKNFSSMADTPIKLEIQDSRGRTILDKKISLSPEGMFDIKYKLSSDTPIGKYDIMLYSLNGRGRIQDSIGNGSFMVQEFVPDTMKITANINNSNGSDGWIKPDNINVNVLLNNLYGTPAINRRVTASGTLRPTAFTFPDYAGYTFTSNLVRNNDTISAKLVRNTQTFQTTSVKASTDQDGNATLAIGFDNDIPTGTYSLNLRLDGFDGGDGKSVQTIINARVSNLDYIVGYKPESDISYIKRNDTRKLKLVALNQTAKQINLPHLVMRLVRRENLTSLIKDTNNQYKYQTISRDTVIQESQLDIADTGSEITLDTKNGGIYYLQILDKDNNILSDLEYFVASDENTDLTGASLPELKIKLDAQEYKAGDTINIGIISPYAGTGLITIERDKVYAYKWFTAKTTSSTQKISLPKDFEGTGYVNVSFVRDINSRDIFTSPYTYAVAPFSTKTDKRNTKIQLSVPNEIQNNQLTIKYQTDKNSDLMIFAVNTGILRVAKYALPNPIRHFFQKAALQVETNQILSLLLPEYKILREVAKTGGGDFTDTFDGLDTSFTNPFGRKNLPPVAYYSGILKAKANKQQEITFDIPEYFTGEISVYAVAVGIGTMGAAHTNTLIKSPVALSVSAPAFVAPGDKFTVNTIISNLAPESGENAVSTTSVSLSDNLIPVSDSKYSVTIPKNTEKLWTFQTGAKNILGNADINITTTLSDENGNQLASRKNTSTISIRPTTTRQTSIKTGMLSNKTTNVRNVKNNMYNAEQSRNLFVSGSPTILIRPLFMYLENYEYLCSEQIVSRTLPYVLIPDNKLIGTTQQDSVSKISKTIQLLGNRQNSDGSFGVWHAGTNYINNINDVTTGYLTAYIMNFLTLARQSGFTVPQSMFAHGIDFLRDFVATTPVSNEDAMAKALAIYVLTANDYVTTSYIDSLQEYADKNIKNWESGIIGPYIAASYKMLKQTNKAFDLIGQYQYGQSYELKTKFNNSVANDAIYTFIARRYFDMYVNDTIPQFQNYINAGNYDSWTAAAIILGLTADKTTSEITSDDIVIFADNAKLQFGTESDFIWTPVPQDATKLRIICNKCDTTHALFYTLISQGFPTYAPAATNGLEITRTFYDTNGNEIHSGNIGDIIDVKIVVRTRDTTNSVANAVISDLLIGGFVPLSDSLTGDMDFGEIREDRILIYTPINRMPKTFTYRAQMSVAGQFAIPAISVTDMYNSAVNATGESGTFTVFNETD